MRCSRVLIYFHSVSNALALILPLLLSLHVIHVMLLSLFICCWPFFFFKEWKTIIQLGTSFPISLLLNQLSLCISISNMFLGCRYTLSIAELKSWLVGDFLTKFYIPSFFPSNFISYLPWEGWCRSTGFTVSSPFHGSPACIISGSFLRHPDPPLSTTELYFKFLTGYKWFVWTWTG